MATGFRHHDSPAQFIGCSRTIFTATDGSLNVSRPITFLVLRLYVKNGSENLMERQEGEV